MNARIRADRRKRAFELLVADRSVADTYAHANWKVSTVSDRIIGMTDGSLHPAATQHLPAFITAPGETDVLMVVMAIILLAPVVGVWHPVLSVAQPAGAHGARTHKVQFEIVAVLCLLALFTHMHLFWVAALLLAMIEFPDIGGWLGRIAGSVEKIAETRPGKGAGRRAGRARRSLWTMRKRGGDGRSQQSGAGRSAHGNRNSSLRPARGADPCLRFFSAPADHRSGLSLPPLLPRKTARQGNYASTRCGSS